MRWALGQGYAQKRISKGVESNFLEELFNYFCYIADILVSGKKISKMLPPRYAPLSRNTGESPAYKFQLLLMSNKCS